MSLLLDARKKSQEAQSTQGGNISHSGLELSLEDHPKAATSSAGAAAPTSSNSTISNDRARIAGQNLFSAKSSVPAPAFAAMAFAGINSNLLLALGGTALLLAAGAGYVWYIGSTSNNQPAHPIARAPSATPIAQQAPSVVEATPGSTSVPEIASAKSAIAKQPSRTARPSARPSQQARSNAPVQIEQHQTGLIDPLLNSAYLAYQSGKFDQAQQLYREALKLDERNTDTLLGLAAIAQRRGADGAAVHYYAKVLELDPRDAVANAGMSALSAGGNRESRLKILLDEQQDSAALHVALGNHYAAQERWGEAQQYYFNAYKLEPKNAGLAFNLAISLERLGQKKLAAQHYQSALQLDTSHSEGFDHTQISQRIEELTR